MLRAKSDRPKGKVKKKLFEAGVAREINAADARVRAVVAYGCELSTR